jgi:hypothetical protein
MHIRVCKYIIDRAEFLHASANRHAIFREVRYKGWSHKWPKHVERNFSWRNSPSGQGLLITEASRSHTDTQHEVEIPWKSDQPHAETYTLQHAALTRDRFPRPRRDSNPQSQQPSGRRPTS